MKENKKAVAVVGNFKFLRTMQTLLYQIYEIRESIKENFILTIFIYSNFFN